MIKTFGFTKVHFYIRSQKCSTDEASTESVLIETINNMNLNDDIMLVQATSPLTTASDFNNGIDLYNKYEGYSMSDLEEIFINYIKENKFKEAWTIALIIDKKS